MIYESVDDALFEKDEKFKTTRLKNSNHNIEKYNVYSFMSGVQVWIYEAIGGLPSTWVVKTKNASCNGSPYRRIFITTLT